MSTDQIITKHSLCGVLYHFSAALRVRNRYPIGRVVMSLHFCSNANRTCLFHASVSNVICAIEFGKASTGDDNSAKFNNFIAILCSSSSGLNVFG